MSDPRRRRSPESSRRSRRQSRRDSRDYQSNIYVDEQPSPRSVASRAIPGSFPDHHHHHQQQQQQQQVPTFSTAPTTIAATGEAASYLYSNLHQEPPPPSASFPERTSTVPAIPIDMNRPHRTSVRRGSRSSLSSGSASSGSSSSYLDISRWYPSWGRGGGVLKTFFKTPSEHRPRRRRSQRKLQHSKKRSSKKGVFSGATNSSSSSVDSDMAYGMGFIRKSKSSRGRGPSPGGGVAYAAGSSVSGKRAEERAARPGMQRRQTDEEIREIGRKLQDVARMQTRADQRQSKSSWEAYQRQSSSGVDASHHRRHHHHHSSSSSDDEWESASEDEDSDAMSALAYGHHEPQLTPRPAKSSVSRMSTASAIAAGSALVAGSAIAAASQKSPDRDAAIVDPKLFGPQNSLRDFIHTPRGFEGDPSNNRPSSAYSAGPRPDPAHEYPGSAESASVEARPLQTVYPVPTSDPGRMEAARASGSLVSSAQQQQQYNSNSTTLHGERGYSNNTSYVSARTEAPPIQAPVPISPVPSRIYDDEHIVRSVSPRDDDSRQPPRRKPSSDDKRYAPTALVGAGVAALGAAILAGRSSSKGKGKGKAKEEIAHDHPEHGQHEKYGHDDHRVEETKAKDIVAQELRLMQEIERLEKQLSKTNQVREARRRDSKRDRDSVGRVEGDVPADAFTEAEKDYERERERRREERRLKRRTYPLSERDSRVSVPSEPPLPLPAADVGAESISHRDAGDASLVEASAPIDVFQFQVPDDAFTTRSSQPKGISAPIIVDVTPVPSRSPSPAAPEQSSSSRRSSQRAIYDEEARDAHRIYEEAHHSTAPIPEGIMAAAISAVEHSRRRENIDNGELGRGRTNSRTADTIQQEANNFYAARRLADRELHSRSRSKSQERTSRSVLEKYEEHDSDEDFSKATPRIITPPEWKNRPPKNEFSEPNADFRFDVQMSPTELRSYQAAFAPVHDPFAERPRPVLNLVMPTPVPTPNPDRQREQEAAASKAPEPIVKEVAKAGAPGLRFGPRGEIIEVFEDVEDEQPIPPVSKRVSWGPSETKQYEEHSPERPASASSDKKSSGFSWGALAAAVTGAGVGAALAKDREPDSPRPEEQRRTSSSTGSRSPPKERPVVPGISSRALTEEPEELPPAPGPKPASPRASQQMPGAFDDDIDFAATLAAGLEHSGFDPEIVIENPDYHRRDSPPGSNVSYSQPFAETVSDLGVYSVDDTGSAPLAREHGYVVGEVDTPGSEKAAPLDDFDDASSRGKGKKSSGYNDIDVVEEAKPDTSRLSKKERRKLEKAAQATQSTEKETQPQDVEAGEDDWAMASTSSKKSKKSKKKRSSVVWDDADTPDHSQVTVPVNAFDYIEDDTVVDDWDTPKKSRKSKRNSKGYDLPDDSPPDKSKRDRRGAELYEPADRDVSSVVSDSRYDAPSNGHSKGGSGDDDRSVTSAPSGSNKRSGGGGFWGLLGGKDQQPSKKDNAGTLGAGAGFAGVAAVAVGAAVAGSYAAEAASRREQEEEARLYAERDVGRDDNDDVHVFEDPEVAPRAIKPAIDPQYGDLLPLPPSPGQETPLDFDENDDEALPSLPDSRPTTPPGQSPAQAFRERENTISTSSKRPHFAAGHARRPSMDDRPLRSPSHTAIPIQFRMGNRSMPTTSPAMRSVSAQSSPVVAQQQLFASPTTPSSVAASPIIKRGDGGSNEFSPPSARRHPPRPTSWDSTREMKPLYLLGRSAARPGSEEEEGVQREELGEMTPFSSSSGTSHLLESEAYGGDAVGLGVDAAPLKVDTDVARFLDSGSLEPTPTGTGPQQAASLASMEEAGEMDTTPLGFPSGGSLPESSYATPGEFPSWENKPPSSTQLEQPQPVEASIDKEVNKPEKKSYFSSALSILPAATLASVGVLLNHGKKDEAHASLEQDDRKLETGNDSSQSSGPPAEAIVEAPPLSATSDLDQQRIHSPVSKELDSQSSSDFQDAQTDFAPNTTLEPQAEAPETITETPIDTADWATGKGSKKKKNKGKKKKQSVSDTPQLPVTPAENESPPADVHQDLPVQDEAEVKAADEADVDAASSTPLPVSQVVRSESPDIMATEAEPSTPTQPDILTDIPVQTQLETFGDVEQSIGESHDDLPSSSAETYLDAPAKPQAEVPSEDMSTQKIDLEDPTTGEAEIAEASKAKQPETADPIEDDWAPTPSKGKKGKKGKKNKKQSISLAENVLDSPTPGSPSEKAVGAVQEPEPVEDVSGAQDLGGPPRWMDYAVNTGEETQSHETQTHEPLEGVTEPLHAETSHDDIPLHSQLAAEDAQSESAAVPSADLPSDELQRDAPTEIETNLPIGQVHELVPKVSEFLVEEPAAGQQTNVRLDEPLRDASAEDLSTVPAAERLEPDVSQFLVEEPVAGQQTDMLLDESLRDISAEDLSTVPAAEQLEPDVSQFLVDEPFVTEDSAVVDQVTELHGSNTRDDIEQQESPLDLPKEPAVSANDESRTVDESTTLAVVTDDAAELDREHMARSPSPVHEVLQPFQPLEDQPPSAAQVIDSEPLPLEELPAPASPILAEPVPQSEALSEDVKPLDISVEKPSDSAASKAFEAEPSIDQTPLPTDLSSQASVLPVQDTSVADDPLSTAEHLPQDTFETQEPVQTPADEAGILNRAADESLSVPEPSSPEKQETFEETLDNEEIARRESEAAQIQDDESEIARLQLKRKPSKKDKSRLKDLKARAQQRAEDAEAAAPSSSAPKELDQTELDQTSMEPELSSAEAEHGVGGQLTEATPVAAPVVVEQDDGTADLPESEHPAANSNIARLADEVLKTSHSPDEGSSAHSQPEPQPLKDPEDLARREAEADLIRDEETELARLKNKKKRKSKDNSRIRVLEANAQERERDAKAAAQRQVGEETVADSEIKGKTQSHVEPDVKTDPLEAISQPPANDELLEDSTPVEADPASVLGSGDRQISDLENTSQSQADVTVHDQVESEITRDADIVSSEAPYAPGQLDDHQKIGDAQDSAAHDQLASPALRDAVRNTETSLSTHDQVMDVSGDRPHENAKERPENATSSSQKPKSMFGGWGTIAAAITGATIGAAAAHDSQPKETQQAEVPPRSRSVEAHEEVKELDLDPPTSQHDISHDASQDIQDLAETQAEGPFHESLAAEAPGTSSSHLAEEPLPLIEPSQQDEDVTTPSLDPEPDQETATENSRHESHAAEAPGISSSHFTEEPLPLIESSQQDEGVTTPSLDPEPEKKTATEAQADSEWDIPTKKSKKDKKKKRKGTLSGESGENSGWVTPVETSEPLIAPEPDILGDNGAEASPEEATSQDEHILSIVDSEIPPANSLETAQLEHHTSEPVTSPQNNFTEDLAPPIFEDAHGDADKDTSRSIEGPEHPPSGESIHSTSPVVTESRETEKEAPLEEILDLPQSLARSAEATSPSTGFLPPVSEPEVTVHREDSPQGADNADDRESGRLSSSPGMPIPDAETVQDPPAENRDLVSATQESEGLALETAPSISITDEPQQLQEKALSWAPARKNSKKDKKKKKRGSSTALSEPASGAQTPISEEAVEPSAPELRQETSTVEEASSPLQDEDLGQLLESQPQPDDWSIPSSSKNKKQSSLSSWEPETSSQTPFDERPRESIEAITAVRDLDAMDTGLATEPALPIDTLQKDTENVIEPDLIVAHEGEAKPLVSENTDQLYLDADLQTGRLEEEVVHKSASISILDKATERQDALVAGGHQPDEDLSLGSEEVIAQSPPVAASLPPTTDEQNFVTAAVPEADLGSPTKDASGSSFNGEQLANQNAPLYSERSVDLPSLGEPIHTEELVTKVDDEEDTAFAAGGKVPDEDITQEVSEPRLFEATHGSPTFTTSDLDAHIVADDESLTVAGGKLPDETAQPLHTEGETHADDNQWTAEPRSDFLDVDRPGSRPQSPAPWGEEDYSTSHRDLNLNIDPNFDIQDDTQDDNHRTAEAAEDLPDVVQPISRSQSLASLKTEDYNTSHQDRDLDVDQKSHIQDDTQDDKYRTAEAAEDLPDVVQLTSRPQSLASLRTEDYNTSQQDGDLDVNQKSHIQDDAQDDKYRTAEAGEEFLDVDQPTSRPQSPAPWGKEDCSTSQRGRESGHDQPNARSVSHVFQQDEEGSLPAERENDFLGMRETALPRDSTVPSEGNTSAFVTPFEEQSFPPADPDPMPELTNFQEKFQHPGPEEGALDEAVEKPDLEQAFVDETAEPVTEDVDEWTPKKLTKKEKRKAKKGSVSAPQPDSTAAGQDDFAETNTAANDQNPPSDSAQNPEAQHGDTQADAPRKSSSSLPETAAVTAAAVVAVPVLGRKLSKKEKRKAKKSISSWDDDAPEIPQPEIKAAEETASRDVPSLASPIAEPESSQDTARELSSEENPAVPEAPIDFEAPSAEEVVADDEWAVPLSRKESKKDKKKKGKQLSLDSSSDRHPLTSEEQPPFTTTGVQESPTAMDRTVKTTPQPSAEDISVVPSSPRPSPEKLSQDLSEGHLKPSPTIQGPELQKTGSVAPSPDIWESEDYFKPKTPESSPGNPVDEPFEKLEIHPAFSRELNTSSENRPRDERPLVGLGLIHRHSSIFQEDNQHTPKLLTLRSANESVESMAIEETPQSVQYATVPSPGLHQQRKFPLSPRLSPRLFPDEPPRSPSPLPEDIKLAQRGSVAMLAARFGGTTQKESGKKKVFNYVNQRTKVEDDTSDGKERQDEEDPRVEDDAASFWSMEDGDLEDKASEPERPGGGSTSSPAYRAETQVVDENVSATHSSAGHGAGRFTPDISETENHGQEIPLGTMVESPILGSQASVEMQSPEPPRMVRSPSVSSEVETTQPTRPKPSNIADTWDLIGSRQRRDEPPSPRPDSAASGSKDTALEESVLPSDEAEHEPSLDNFIPPVDFRRSISRGLPVVQEEPLEEEVESGQDKAPLAVTTSDINRDSGFATDSPHQAWTRRFDDIQQQRDSGVQLRDYRDRSPGLLSSRGSSPDPNRVSRSSVDSEGVRLDDRPKRSPLSKYERRLQEDAPVLEAQESPVTPEPHKGRVRSDGSRTHKYPNLGPEAGTATALVGGAALLAAQQSAGVRSPSAEAQTISSRSASGSSPQPETGSKLGRATSNTRMYRDRTPEPLNLQPGSISPSLLRHSGTPPLRSRRTRSGDLRSLSQSSNQSVSDLGVPPSAGVRSPGAPPASATGQQHSTRSPALAPAANKAPVPASSSSSTSDLRKTTAFAAATPAPAAHPVANEGRVRTKDMADVYDGFGEGRMGSPRSPTRPHSMRRRQSMQVLDLENRVEQLLAENRALAEAKANAELHSSNRVTSSLADRDNEIETLKQTLEYMRKEVNRLTEVNEGLNSAISQSAVQHQDRYRLLETEHAATAGELNNLRSQHGSFAQTIADKDAEIRSLREQLEATKEQVREMQRQILASNPAGSDFLQIRDVDYFDHRCQQLCSHVQQWVLRFSKFSDMRACRLTSELNDEKIIDRLDNAVLDGSNVDKYLNDRVRRRDIFMSVAMTMIWEFVFTRYLFGMDREQRQKLKALEKLLLEVGPAKAVRQWRAVTLTLLSKRDSFADQREQDTEAVVQAVFQTLSMILPPPSNLEDQIQGQLRKVLREAVDLSIEMRTQRAEYMMLPPLQPEYDASGDLAEPHPFNAQLMSERSSGGGGQDKSGDDDLQAEGAIVRVVLFPLVVKKGDDDGVGDDEVVVCPAQVIVRKPGQRSSSRRSMRAPSSDAGGVSLLRGGSPATAPNRSNVSMAEAEYIEGGF